MFPIETAKPRSSAQDWKIKAKFIFNVLQVCGRLYQAFKLVDLIYGWVKKHATPALEWIRDLTDQF